LRKLKKRIIFGILAIILIIILLFLFSNLSQDNGLGTVSGTITYGPTYPGPCREGMDCSDKPYNGTVYIKSDDGSATLKEFKTDSTGRFSIEIKSGTYFLEVGQRFISVCGQNFLVEKDKTTNMNITCDTGMR
jgi:hypothetical protein